MSTKTAATPEDWTALERRCAEQTTEWERVRAELRAFAAEDADGPTGIRDDDDLLALFEHATETRRSNASASLSLMRG